MKLYPILALSLAACSSASAQTNVPLPDFVRAQSEPFTAPSAYEVRSGATLILSGQTANATFCAPISIQGVHAGNDEVLISYVHDPNNGNATTYHVKTVGAGPDVVVACEPVTNFLNVAIGSGVGSASHSVTGGTVGPFALGGSTIWAIGDMTVFTQGSAAGVAIGLNAINPPIQDIGVVSNGSLSGSALGTQFLNSSFAAITPGFQTTLFYFTADSLAHQTDIDLGRADAGKCWLGWYPADGELVAITTDGASPPHRHLNASHLTTPYVAIAWCLAYSF